MGTGQSCTKTKLHEESILQGGLFLPECKKTKINFIKKYTEKKLEDKLVNKPGK